MLDGQGIAEVDIRRLKTRRTKVNENNVTHNVKYNVVPSGTNKQYMLVKLY